MEYILIIIAIILLIIYFGYIFGSNKRSKKLLKKFSKVKNSAGITGGAFVQASFEVLGFNHCQVQYSEKEHMNCYVPKLNLIVLYKDYCFNPSLSALGVSAHELGHCIQHQTKSPLYVLTQISRIISKISLVLFAPVLTAGIVLLLFSKFTLGGYIVLAGLILLVLSILVKLLLIPYERNASNIGINFLKKHNVIVDSEEHKIRKILKSAGNTYIADFYRSIGIKK